MRRRRCTREEPLQPLGQIQDGHRSPAPDVEDPSGSRIGLGRRQAGGNDVRNEHEVASLPSVAVDFERTPGQGGFEELGDDSGVVRVRRLAGPVDIEEPEARGR